MTSSPMPEDKRRHAPATERNRAYILDVLRTVLPRRGTVLEVASGTGEHAVFFARLLAPVVWQPSDLDPANRDSIAAWSADAALANLRPPLALDVTETPWPVAPVEAVVCINMIHIAPWRATLGLLAGAAAVLPKGAPLYLYGPFSRGGTHSAPSNAAFDADLRSRDPDWGVRDLEAVAAAALPAFGRPEIVKMPANNLSVIFRRC